MLVLQQVIWWKTKKRILKSIVELTNQLQVNSLLQHSGTASARLVLPSIVIEG